MDSAPMDDTPMDGAPVDVTQINFAPVDGASVDVTPMDGAPVDVTQMNFAPMDGASVDVTPMDGAPVDVTCCLIMAALFQCMCTFFVLFLFVEFSDLSLLLLFIHSICLKFIVLNSIKIDGNTLLFFLILLFCFVLFLFVWVSTIIAHVLHF